MSINAEIKGQLAKLLATEDLIVEHRKVPTASFDVDRRVLILPLWNRASGTVYDLLVGHEVGHALFTPNEDWTEKVDVPQQFVNVVEDVRIEKMMKKKYPGLAKSFFNGYKELNADDFFSIQDEDLRGFNLADRVNLHCKIGNFTNIPFNQEELEILKIVENTETFDDVLKAAEILYKYCKDDREMDKTPANANNADSGEVNQGGSSDSNNMGQNQGDSFTSSSDAEQQSSSDDFQNSSQPSPSNSDSSNDGGGKSGDLEVKTDSNLSDKLEGLTDSKYGEDSVYVEVPKIDTKIAVVKNQEVHEYITNYFVTYENNLRTDIESRGYSFTSPYLEADTKYTEFKRSTQKEVSYLVKEFECKKSADSYSRSFVSRSGVLDTTKLHTYKYNEDLFKKVNVIPDGKNHGLIFVLDWSGSMSDVLLDTCKQLYNLLWFCKKVNVPFEVYAFTNEWNYYERDENGARLVYGSAYDVKENSICIYPEFRMLNLFSSKTNAKTLDDQMKNIWRIALSYYRMYSVAIPVPDKLCLSGTPLNESIITLFSIIPEFKRDYKVQKVQCVILTDGEACGSTYHKMVKRTSYLSNETTEYLGHSSIRAGNSFLRDRKLGTTYSISCGFIGLTDALLRNIRDRFPDVNFVGIRILEGRDCSNFIHRYHNDFNEVDSLRQQWKKNKSVVIRKSAYHAYFGLSSSALSSDTEFEVAECATKTQIKRAFAKSLGAKKLNKKVLSEFIELIA